MIDGKILIKLDMIRDAPGVVLHSKNINGTRYYLLSENDIEKIMSNHMSIISELRKTVSELSSELKKIKGGKVESNYKRQTGNLYGGGYGD